MKRLGIDLVCFPGDPPLITTSVLLNHQLLMLSLRGFLMRHMEKMVV